MTTFLRELIVGQTFMLYIEHFNFPYEDRRDRVHLKIFNYSEKGLVKLERNGRALAKWCGSMTDELLQEQKEILISFR